MLRGSCYSKGGSTERLEDKVLSALEMVGCKIHPDNIEYCHRLSKKSDNEINFSRRKDCQHVLQVEKDLRNLSL